MYLCSTEEGKSGLDQLFLQRAKFVHIAVSKTFPIISSVELGKRYQSSVARA